MMLDPLLALLFLGLLIWFAFSLLKPENELIVNIPGPRPLPLVGNIFNLLGRGGNGAENFLDFISSLGRVYGRRSKFVIGRTPHVVLSDVNDIQKLLSSDVHVNKPPLFKFFEDWIGVSIVSAPAKEWWTMRRLLNPLFKKSVLEKFIPEMDFQAILCAKKLDEKATKSKGVSFDVSSLMANLTMDILAKTAMGAEIHSQVGEKPEFAVAMEGLAALTTKRWLSPWLHPKMLWELSSIGKKFILYKYAIHRMTDKIIHERRKVRTELKQAENLKENTSCNKTNRAFLDTLLDLQEEGNHILSRIYKFVRKLICFWLQMQCEISILAYSTGHETISTSLQWVLARLGYHKEIQEKVHTELDIIFQGDLTRPVTSADLRRMEYLEMVIKETLRLHSAVPVIMRMVEFPVHLDGGAVIKPGVTVILHLAAIHKDPKSFPSPEEFIPERFSREESAKRHPFAYLPFSLGPRMCIGHKFAMMEMKTTIANILRRFHIHGDVSPNDIPTEFIMALRPRDGVAVTFKPRQQHTFCI